MFNEKRRAAWRPFWKIDRVSPARIIIFGFLGLILLMIVVTIVGKIFTAKDAKKKAAAPAAAPAATAPAAPQKTAPGAAGQLKLHNVEPKTAAMVMAIVADKMGKPLNELRFISIK